VFVCRYFRKYPYLFVGWLWYLGTLVPVIGIVQVGYQAMADRFAYVPLIGVFVMLVWGIADIAQNKLFKNIINLISGITLIILFIITSSQIQYWKDTITLFEHTLKIIKINYSTDDIFIKMANRSIGDELLKKNKIDEAITRYKENLILYPKSEENLVGLGRAFNIKGENDKAIAMLRQALNLNSESIIAHHNLGFVFFQEGHVDEAIIEYKKAIALYNEALNNEDPSLHNNLGNALVEKGKINEAINEYREVLRINPEHAGAHNNLGMIFMHQGKVDEALEQFQEAVRIQPLFANAHYQLAIILKQKGLNEKAICHYNEAVRINPEFEKKKD
jgi:tetratricopeptide (TPR) repeat protein